MVNSELEDLLAHYLGAFVGALGLVPPQQRLQHHRVFAK